MSFTPGPWIVLPPYTDRAVFTIGKPRDDGAISIFAEVNSQGGTEEHQRANARLIASAPDLLNALKELELRTRQYLSGKLVTFPCALLGQVQANIAIADPDWRMDA